MNTISKDEFSLELSCRFELAQTMAMDAKMTFDLDLACKIHDFLMDKYEQIAQPAFSLFYSKTVLDHTDYWKPDLFFSSIVLNIDNGQTLQNLKPIIGQSFNDLLRSKTLIKQLSKPLKTSNARQLTLLQKILFLDFQQRSMLTPEYKTKQKMMDGYRQEIIDNKALFTGDDHQLDLLLEQKIQVTTDTAFCANILLNEIKRHQPKR